MKKSTHRSKRNRKAAIKRRLNRLKFLRKELALDDREENELVDRVSELPDEILISILSRLTLPQAIATSILSTRWRYLHTYIDHLKFPPFILNSSQFKELYPRGRRGVKVSHYVSAINKTLDSYRGNGVLEEFRVEMHYVKGANIERWLEFALDRQVKIVDIRMCKMKITGGFYTLNLLNLIGRPLPGFKCLKQLYFHGVHVDDLEVQLLLSNFPLLESLTIEFSTRLRNVSVVGNGMILKLKRLDISYAGYLKSIEIRDMINLISFKCYGHQSRYVLRLSNLPKLIEFSISEEHAKNTLAVLLPTIPSYIHDQLRLLKVWIPHPHLIQTHLPAYELINVKHLELKVYIEARYSTFQLFPLIEACSSLEKLEIEQKVVSKSKKFDNVGIFRKRGRIGICFGHDE
ncbi:putative F-box/LRR-repeat protein at3g58880 [Phtheirospermum japonicum]|uniref:Putative F-box/LRR-repeat protein at3g58880 n=1 Tax=Phtheirospermum japonicum TaxID=374723 RepID=A0A830CXK3_9LAMI|nr:putative F-box/LRR-repeat protein at3g58880 [Phtheirospermum japonicum]